MNALQVLKRNLSYYARTHLVVAASIAIATAVMSGAMIVGDSINRSVYDLVLAKVGRIDAALLSPGFFRIELSEAIAADAPDAIADAASFVHVRGHARRSDDPAAIPNVNVLGVDASFWPFFDGAAPEPEPRGREVAVNRTLADALRLKLGDTLLVTIGAAGPVPTDTLFAPKEKDDTVRTLRLTVGVILETDGAGAFSLENAPAIGPNLYVSRRFLTGRAYLDQRGKANGILLRSAKTAPDDATLRRALSEHLTLDDYGVKVVTHARYASVETEAVVLPTHVPAAARRTAEALSATSARTSVYLANQLSHGDASIHYLTVAGLDTLEPFSYVGEPPAALGEDELLLNTWAAEDLGAAVGDTLEMTWFLPDGSDEERSATFRVAGLVAMEGPGADRALVPEFAGITEFENIEDWDPPFAFDKARISDRDESYWDQYGSAPKAYLSLSRMQTIWQGTRQTPRPDWVTSMRIAPAPDAKALEAALLETIDPIAAGLVFQRVRERAIDAAGGTMDFGGLFASMSFFLVLSAIGLAGMTMRVSLLRRARSIGLLFTQGFTPKRVQGLLRAEALIVGLTGAALGCGLAVGYARGLLHAMTQWWSGAIPDTAIELRIGAVPLLSGVIFALLALWAAVAWSFRELRDRGVLELLGGVESLGVHGPRSASHLSARLFYGAGAPAVLLALLAAPLGIPSQWAFMASGFLLLIAGISGGSYALQRALTLRGAQASSLRLALRNAATNRQRSLLALGLLASAAFIIVAVAVNTRTYTAAGSLERDSGTGGFALRARTMLPMAHALETPAGRAALGFTEADEALFAETEIVSFLMSAGDDVSLNLAKPVAPRVLGASETMLARGGFAFAKSAAAAGAEWLALHEASPAIPMIGDAASVQWQLHSGLGKTLDSSTASGTAIQLQCVGMLAESIFQSELIISEQAFREHFDAGRAGRYYLLAPPAGREDDVAHRLRQVLGDYGLDVTPTHEILNTFIDVQNTYLAMFLILGGLGLLLGTFGMVAVLVRNALERRREFAVMLAMGFRRHSLARLLALENAALLIAGVACGTLAAFVAFIPHIMTVAQSINWVALLSVLLVILVTGLSISGLTARWSTRGRLLEALRDE